MVAVIVLVGVEVMVDVSVGNAVFVLRGVGVIGVGDIVGVHVGGNGLELVIGIATVGAATAKGHIVPLLVYRRYKNTPAV